MGFEFVGVYFVSDEVKNHEQVQKALEEKAEQLRDEAQQKFDDYVKSIGLRWEMGVIMEDKRK